MKNKGFTLIELLAVIIILGILMLIAIPSVTTYINNSRKETYIDTIKELIKGATNLVNSGELEISNPKTTYYIPSTCIASENGNARSPYGEFDPAYIVVTYDGDNYDYYWMSKDKAGMGIKKPITIEELSKDSIESNILTSDVTPTYGIGGKNHIVTYNNDCSSSSSSVAEHTISGHNYFPNQSSGTLKKVVNGSYGIFGKEMDKNVVEKIYTVNNKNVPSNAVDSWDASEENDGSVMAWFLDEDNNSLYELYLGQEGGVRANPDSTKAFSNYYNVIYMDLSYLNTSDVTNMSNMFYSTGYSMAGCWDCQPFIVKGLERFDTSKVTNMSNMFYYFGRTYKEWDIGDLSGWDTSNVTDFSSMFYRAAVSAKKVDIGNVGNWNVSKATTMSTMFLYFGNNSSEWSIGDLSDWDTRNVTTMYGMFNSSTQNSNSDKTKSIGTLNIYANNIDYIFHNAASMKVTLNIYSKPSNYDYAFAYAATHPGSKITVNYSSNTTNIDNIINTRTNMFVNYVVKGTQLD